MKAICTQCSNEYSVPPYRAATTKFCSRRCLALASRVQVKAACAVCGSVFEHISSRSNKAKYCSRECYYKAMHLKGSVTCSCKHCGKTFQASPSEKRVYCSRACVSKSAKATWRPDFTTVRKAMVHRNLISKCERCGYDEAPHILGVHHKDRDRRNNTPINLEVLCPNCHSLEHSKHVAHGFKE